MIYLLIATSIFGLDMWCKKKAEKRKYGSEFPILGGHIILTRCHNKGAFLNLLEGKRNWLTALSTLILAFLSLFFLHLLRQKDRGPIKLGFALVIGGGISNLVERIKKGYVTDYFSFKQLKKIVFNLADMAIFLGGLILILTSLCTKASAVLKPSHTSTSQTK